MKILNRMKSGFLKAAFILLAAGPMLVSCNGYDDTELQEKIDILTDRLFTLEERMNSEFAALKAMIDGQLFISNVSRDASTGVVTLTLSNGSTLELLPETDLSHTVTYITMNGVKYWAYIDADGKTVLFTNSDGEAVPVVSAVPKVIERDGDSYLVIGGVEYPLGGNSVFSDYELLTDELTGDVYAVTFTFGEDMTFTVTVDGACRFSFVAPTGGFGQNVIIDNYFIAEGMTENVQIEMIGVVDYVLQIPDGWRVKETQDIYMGTKYLSITAPKKELVESGVAAGEGDLKVVAVLEGGKATVSRLYLTSRPFEVFAVSYGKADIEMYNGLQKFVYGVIPASEYDEASILETAESLLTAYDYPAGYGLSTSDLYDCDLAALAGNSLIPGEKYVFWALPAIYYVSGEEAGYYVAEGTFEMQEFTYSSVEFTVSDESFRDAKLTMSIEGADAYYTALVPAEDFLIEDVLYYLNVPGYYTEQTDPMSYTGSIFTFAGIEGTDATDYVAWLAAAEAGKTYSASDVVVVEFSTLSLTPGGNVNVSAGTAQLKPTEIMVPLSAQGAETIYYAFMTASDVKKYADDAAKASYLFEKGKSVKAESVNASASGFNMKMKPETEYFLLAVASDSEGKYGAVFTEGYKTTEISYNDLSVELSVLRNDPDNVVVGIEAKGAQELLYWIGKVSDNTWKSVNYLGGSVETAQVFMYMNPTHSRLTTVMEKYPVSDGKITMTDLSYQEEYVIVAMAKDSEGGWSKAFALNFIPNSKAIGEVVLSTDAKWAEAKPVVEFLPETFRAASGMMSGSYGFNVTVPVGFTAYVLAGTDAYLADANTTLSVEQKIVKIIELVDLPCDNSIVVDEVLWETQGYPYGYEFYHYEHGYPLGGEVVVWGSEEFHNSMCDCGGNGTQTRVLNNVEVEFKSVIYINEGQTIRCGQPYAIGSKTESIDKVFVVCQDLAGNCYEAFEYDAPLEYFQNATSRDE